MTTDDLQRLADAFPEWCHIEIQEGFKPDWADHIRITRGTLDGYGVVAYREPETGHALSSAIFSALLDEIAEVEFGCYLVRFCATNADPPTWYWSPQNIENGAPHEWHRPTKLAALLALKG